MRGLAVTFLALVVLAALWSATGARKAIAPAQVVDGNCVYKNATIENGSNFSSEKPCQSWTCVAQQSAVIITACSVVVPGPGCNLEPGVGAFPNCCKTAICP